MFELSEDHKQIRDLARDFARSTRSSRGPRSVTRPTPSPPRSSSQLAEMGFMGMFVPEEYGGAGLDILVLRRSHSRRSATPTRASA